MPSISGGGFNPQFIPQTAQVKAAQAAPAPAPPAAEPPKTLAKQPTPTSTTTAKVEALTSDQTQQRVQILIRQTPVLNTSLPQLQILSRTSVSGDLAQVLVQHQPAQAEQLPQQAQNPHAQVFAGQQQAVSQLRTKSPNESEDSAWQNTAQSGKKNKKDEQEGEFSSLTDSSGQGMGGGSAFQDNRKRQQQQEQPWGEKKKLSELKNPPKPPGFKSLKHPGAIPSKPQQKSKDLWD